MLPGTALRLARDADPRSDHPALDIPAYVGSYLAVWALFGVLVFALDRPHTTTTAGAIVVAAGIYELTPVKRTFREMCHRRVTSGLGLAACCVGSTSGLMLVMIAMGAMSLTWMAVIAAAVLMQKLIPPRAVIDISVAVAIVAIGINELVT
jgi:predicted metal-binding membrane protein